MLVSEFNAPIKPIHLHLNGTWEEMGEQYATNLALTLLNQFELASKELLPVQTPKKSRTSDEINILKAFREQRDDLLKIAKKKYPKEILVFFEAAVKKYKQIHPNLSKPLTLKKMIFCDQLPAISKLLEEFLHPDTPFEGSSATIAMQNSKKNLLIGRGFDWVKNKKCLSYHPMTMTMHCTTPGYPNTIFTVGVVGGVTNMTVINNHGLFLSINGAGNSTNGAIEINRPYILGEALIAMFQIKTFEELRTWALITPCDFAVNITVASGNKMTVIEASPHAQNNDDNFLNREREPTEDHLMVVTNSFQMSEWEQYLGYPQDPNKVAESQARFEILMQKGKQELATIEGEKSLRIMTQLMEQSYNLDEEPQGATKYHPSQNYLHDTPSQTYLSLAFKIKRDGAAKVALRHQQNVETLNGDTLQGKWTEWEKLHPFDTWSEVAKEERNLVNCLREFGRQVEQISITLEHINTIAQNANKSAFTSTSSDSHIKKFKKHLPQNIDHEKLTSREHSELFNEASNGKQQGKMFALLLKLKVIDTLKKEQNTATLEIAFSEFDNLANQFLSGFLATLSKMCAFQNNFNALSLKKQNFLENISQTKCKVSLIGNTGIAAAPFQSYTRLPLLLRTIGEYALKCENSVAIKNIGGNLSSLYAALSTQAIIVNSQFTKKITHKPS